MKITQFLRMAVLVLGVALGIYIVKPDVFTSKPGALTKVGIGKHIVDQAGVIPPGDMPRFEQYMKWIMDESGVDMRFVFVPNTGGESIEMLAAHMMDESHIGKSTGQERGLLLLYDMERQRLKIEVGYGLEGWFTDAYISYLVDDHARLFFSSGNLSWGLRSLLRLLQHRIREAVIGNEFDPRVLSKVQTLSHLSGGAGVSRSTGIGDGKNHMPMAAAAPPLAFPAGVSPEETYTAYIDWLSSWPVSPDIDFLTPSSRAYLKRFQASPAYASFILMGEYGKHYTIVERNDLALLFFTDTPFVSPHFFIRQDGRWRMDLVAEVQNTREHVGGPLTWSYSGQNDTYTQAFKDLLVKIKGYIRFKDGDNRMLTIHGG